MDWMQEALSYPECNIARVRDFAQETEMKLAIGQYNRAVRNLRNDSMDIAIIALRKLAASYPSFAQAVLLYGCCQMAAGNLHAGRDAFARADVDNFTERFRARTEEYLEAAQAALDGIAPDSDAPAIAEEEYRIRPTAPLVRRGSATRRRIRIRPPRTRDSSGDPRPPDAGGQPARGVREPLTMRFPILADYRKILVLAVAAALIGLAVFGVARLVSGWIEDAGPRPASDKERLSWLIGRIEEAAVPGQPDADVWAGILAEYREHFDAAASPTPGVSTVMTTPPGTSETTGTTASTTEAPTPTATPIPTTTPNHTGALVSADGLLADAKGRMAGQPVEAYRLLNAMADILTGIPGEARAAGIALSAAEMLAEKDSLIAANRWHLCESHRIAAEEPWQVRDYASCLPLYEAIYTLDPAYYTGYCAFRLGLCYEQIGATAKALECYRTVEGIGPASPQYAGALARIQALG